MAVPCTYFNLLQRKQYYSIREHNIPSELALNPATTTTPPAARFKHFPRPPNQRRPCCRTCFPPFSRPFRLIVVVFPLQLGQDMPLEPRPPVNNSGRERERERTVPQAPFDCTPDQGCSGICTYPGKNEGRQNACILEMGVGVGVRAAVTKARCCAKRSVR